MIFVKPHYLALIIFPLFSANLFSQQIVLAVIDFEGKGVTQIEASALTDKLRTEIINLGNVTLVERGEMDEILQEQGFQQTGCVSSECMVEVGLLLGATQIVGGSISRVGNTFSVSARIIDIETGKIINSANYDYSGVIDELLISGMRNISQLLFLAKGGGIVELDKDIEYYDNGKIKSEGRRIAGRKHGRWIYYHEDGRIVKVGNYKDGKMTGEWTFYYDNGTLQKTTTYEDNKLNGRWVYYHKNGKIMKVGDYKDGKMTGEWTFYYDDGTLQQTTTYEDNRFTGKWTYYSREGEILWTIERTQKRDYLGISTLLTPFQVTEYYLNGKKKASSGLTSSGYIHGKRTVFGLDGQILSQERFHSGHGLYIDIHENGQKKVEGICKHYGIDLETGTIIMGRTGQWRKWNESGELIFDAKYGWH